MKNLKNMISEFHGQLEQYTKEMKNVNKKRFPKLNEKRKGVIDEYGVGDLGRGSGEDE